LVDGVVVMSIFSWANSRIKKLNWLDLGCIKLTCIVVGVLLAVLIPSLIKVDVWLLVAVAVILALKPALKVFKN
jgi:hypothetical protein